MKNVKLRPIFNCGEYRNVFGHAFGEVGDSVAVRAKNLPLSIVIYSTKNGGTPAPLTFVNPTL